MSSLAQAGSLPVRKRQKTSQNGRGDKKNGNSESLCNVPPSDVLRSTSKDDTVPPPSTFGLENEAMNWYREETKKINVLYLKIGQQYNLYESKNGKVSSKRLNEAFAEYDKRIKSLEKEKEKKKKPLVVLVATGVADNWVPDEGAGSARFLLFPKLAQVKGALFLTYMPGPEHGAVGGTFSNILGKWWSRYEATAYKYLTQGQSSASYGRFQPDKRLLPKKKFRDRNGNDRDKGNKNLPYSRFIWEIEYDNRDPVEIRQRGKKYMRDVYTRLFLAAKFYAPEEDGRLEAVAVLWEKADNNSNVVSVREAVSFGTKDLSEEHKQQFSPGKQKDRLVGVTNTQWRRPQPIGNPDNPTPDDWKLTVPLQGLIYKIMKEKQADGSRPYLEDSLEDGQLGHLIVDLRRLVSEFPQYQSTDEEIDDGE